ncbi:MAG: DUF86 domain-containing protein [Deltaproteobacteria bacterium]|nr:DUF86 domain-containing protein [Deltaproteobacteria bacterium]
MNYLISAALIWKNIADTRDKLIHHYFGINIDIVWDIVINDIFDLQLKRQEIENLSDRV